MGDMQRLTTVRTIRPLNTQQRDRCREKAVERVHRLNGDAPHRSDFDKELEPIWDVTDWFAVLVFAAAVIKSGLNIVLYVGNVAQDVVLIDSLQSGVRPSLNLYVAASQIGALLLAEVAMVLFVIAFASSKATSIQAGIVKASYLIMGLTAATFVFYANIQSGSNLFISLLPPLFTVGIGLRFEMALSKALVRRKELTQLYNERYAEWQHIQNNPSLYPKFQTFLMQAYLQQLASLKGNEWLLEADGETKRHYVGREMAAEHWAEAAVKKAAEPPRNKTEEVMQELRQRPELQELTLKELADQFGVSTATVSNARKQVRD
jgi:hypothetical protein